MLRIRTNLYILYRAYKDLICPKRDILYTRRTCKLFNKPTQKRDELNGKTTKRSPKQIDERPPRPSHPPIPKITSHARLPNHLKHPQKLRSILRPKHNLPTVKPPRRKRIRRKHLGPNQPKTKKSIHTNQRRRRLVKLHRRLTKRYLPQTFIHRDGQTIPQRHLRQTRRHDNQGT